MLVNILECHITVVAFFFLFLPRADMNASYRSVGQYIVGLVGFYLVCFMQLIIWTER